MDGNNDGSLVDTYRYAIDAAELDFLMVSEHNGTSGPDIEYINWLLQQTADVWTLPGKFVPLYGYERSVDYPNGHRNVIFAKRGNPDAADTGIGTEGQDGGEGALRVSEEVQRHRDFAHVRHDYGHGLARQRS